ITIPTQPSAAIVTPASSAGRERMPIPIKMEGTATKISFSEIFSSAYSKCFKTRNLLYFQPCCPSFAYAPAASSSWEPEREAQDPSNHKENLVQMALSKEHQYFSS